MTASDAKEWVDFFKSLIRYENLTILVLIIIIAYLFINPEKILVWKGIIQSVLIFSKRAQKNSISNRVCGSIRYATRNMADSERDLFPEDVKIEWKDGDNETRESFLDGKQIIIRMNRTDNIYKTTSIAAIEMAKTGVLYNGKRYMDKEIGKASDYLIARKLVANINNGQSLGYFDEMYFRPLYDTNTEFKGYFDQLITADKNGMYVSVFLNEIRKMADELFPDPASEKAERDTIDFLKFLYDLCTKKDRSFRYSGSYIKVDVAFTGDWRVLNRAGYDFYVKKCFDALNEGINTVYIYAIGMRMKDAIGVEETFHAAHPKHAETKRTPYVHTFADQGVNHGICIEFQKCAQYSFKMKQDQTDAYRAITT